MNRYKIENFLIGQNNSEAFDIIESLVRDNLNICVTGSMGVGKTTMVKSLIKVVNVENNIVLPESPYHMELVSHYPERNIYVKKSEDYGNEDVHNIYKRRGRTTVVMDELHEEGNLKEYFRQYLIPGTNTFVTHHAKTTLTLIQSLSNELVAKGFFNNIEAARRSVLNHLDVDIHLAKSDEGVIHLERISVIGPVSNELRDIQIKDVLRYNIETNKYDILANTITA